MIRLTIGLTTHQVLFAQHTLINHILYTIHLTIDFSSAQSMYFRTLTPPISKTNPSKVLESVFWVRKAYIKWVLWNWSIGDITTPQLESFDMMQTFSLWNNLRCHCHRYDDHDDAYINYRILTLDGVLLQLFQLHSGKMEP